MPLIDSGPIEEFIQNGLNSGKFGHDAIEILTEVHYAPEAVVRCKELKTTYEGIPADRLRALAEADREGRIVVLPCKVGDTVYRIVNDAEPHITKDLVCEIRVSASVTLVISLIGDRIICEDDFGKIVFLSYQEAEAALEKETDNEQ